MFKWRLIPSMIKNIQYDRKETRDLGYNLHHCLCSILFGSEEHQPFSEAGVTRSIVMKPVLSSCTLG